MWLFCWPVACPCVWPAVSCWLHTSSGLFAGPPCDVCVRCGGLFARDRFDAHRDYWCPKLGVVDSGDMDDLSDQMGNVRTTGRIPDGILYGDNRSHGSEGTFHQGSQQNTHDDGSMEEDEGYYCESF